MVLAPSQVEENWDLRRPLVVFILCAVNPPLIPKSHPFRGAWISNPDWPVGTRGLRDAGGEGWGGADWLEEAGRGKLPGMFLTPAFHWSASGGLGTFGSPCGRLSGLHSPAGWVGGW